MAQKEFLPGSTLTFVPGDYTQSRTGITFEAHPKEKTTTHVNAKPPGPPAEQFDLKENDTIAISLDGAFTITTM